MTSEEMDPSLSTQQDIQLPKPVRHTKIRSNPMFGITEPIPDELVKVEKPCGEGDGGGGSSPFEPIIDASFKNGLEWIKNIPPYLDLAFLEAPIALDPSPNVYLMLDGSFSMKKPKQGYESAQGIYLHLLLLKFQTFLGMHLHLIMLHIHLQQSHKFHCQLRSVPFQNVRTLRPRFHSLLCLPTIRNR